jgi:uncharacterized protein (DUF2336 family)
MVSHEFFNQAFLKITTPPFLLYLVQIIIDDRIRINNEAAEAERVFMAGETR